MPWIKDSIEYSEAQLRAAHPNTSFPAVLTAENVSDFGYVWQEPAPTTEPELTLEERLNIVRTQANTLILSVYPEWYQCNCALGIYPSAVSEKMTDDIAAVITESNRLEDEIIAGNNPLPNWPTIGV